MFGGPFGPFPSTVEDRPRFPLSQGGDPQRRYPVNMETVWKVVKYRGSGTTSYLLFTILVYPQRSYNKGRVAQYCITYYIGVAIVVSGRELSS